MTATARGAVYGRVQGVSFRAFARREALRNGVDGYARNRPDGSVEFALSGARESVQRVLDAMHAGPPLARVERVDVAWRDFEAFDGFTTG